MHIFFTHVHIPLLFQPKGGFKSYEMPEGFPPVPDIPGLLKAPTTIEDFDVSEKDTAAILEIMFKPKEWTEGERKWKQHVNLTGNFH